MSPAIDVGNNAAPGLPAVDLDNNGRIKDGDKDGTATVDLGAYEYFIGFNWTMFLPGITTNSGK